ncbi:MAG TPA: Gx transporter family protein [Bacillota bacterium]|nr:Gx transporter family protein [Bacillota bacterium]
MNNLSRNSRVKMSKARRLALDGAMLCVALALSYLESILPAWTLVPLPGVKPGLANIVTVLLVRRGYVADAAAVSFARICLSAMLFGGPVSYFISLSGGAFAFFALCVCTYALGKFVGPLGTSVMSAAAHNIGQIFAVSVIMSPTAAIAYLPVLLFASLFTGTITGIILILLDRVKFPLS